MHAFEIEIDGKTYGGFWQAGDYDRLTVQSDHGSTYAYLDDRDPQALAASLLGQIVRRSERQTG
ncbi:hypothetical protein [Caulobacter segnis]